MNIANVVLTEREEHYLYGVANCIGKTINVGFYITVEIDIEHLALVSKGVKKYPGEEESPTVIPSVILTSLTKKGILYKNPKGDFTMLHWKLTQLGEAVVKEMRGETVE
jgi:hypothetical protein